VPYLPRIAIEWAGSDPSTTFRVVDGSLIFADISGFTALSEKLARKGRVGAEELTETLSRCFGELLAVAYDAGGSLIKFGGDALLLFFDGDGHAERACASALRMRATMGEVGRVATSVGNVRLRMSIGVHSGTLHFFRVGASHHELILTGPGATGTVEMESAADANEIVISPATAERVDARVVGDPKGPGFLLRNRKLEVAGGLATTSVEAGPEAAASVPVALREQLLAGNVESEHRHVSVAFVHFDEVDRLIDDMGPGPVAQELDRLVRDAQAAAEEHGVTFLATDVDKDGGKIILVSGAPRAMGDDEGRMLRCLRQIADGRRALPVRIGVNHGHVFVGEVGPPFRRTYTVMGDAVNLAARLMAKAGPGQILATGVMLDHSATTFETEPLPPFMVKGKSQPVQAYVVGSQGDRRHEDGRNRLPLVGRDAEIATLTAALEGARAGAGGLVDISGEAGLGKSRLLHEAAAMAADFRVVRAFCEPYEAQTPYYAFRFLLRGLAGIARSGVEGGDDLRARVAEAAPELLPWLPLLATVADVDVAPTSEASDLDERFRRQRTQRVVVDLLRAIVEGPLLLAVDDGQWMDGLSAELLGAVAEAAQTQRWLVCVARRTDAAAPDATGPEGATVALSPGALDDAAAHALVSAATDGAPLLPHERDGLVAQAGGNPLFLEELLRARAGSASDAPLPASLEAVVATQIDRLPPADRRLLRYTSVLGSTFDVGLLAAVTGGELRTAAAAIRRFPGMVELSGPHLLRFRNECYRQVAYDALPYRRRRALHGTAGEALERATAGREVERAGALSLHFLHAQDYERCWRYARLAAHHARATYANAEAVELFERALSIRRHVASATDAEVAETWEALGGVAVWAGAIDRARLAYSRARSLRKDEPTAYAELCGKEYRVAMHQGRGAGAVRWLRRGLRVLNGEEDEVSLARRAELRHFYAHSRQQGGHPRDALKWCQLAVDDALRSGHRRILASAYLLEDWALMALGRVDEAVHSRQALAICEELGEPGRIAEVLVYLGNFAGMEGKWGEALDLYARANEAYMRAGNTVDAAFSACNSAEFLVYQGRYEEAEPRLREALEVWESMNYTGGLAEVLTHLGRLHLNRGEVDEAVQLYERVRRLCHEAGDAREIGAVGALAECRLRTGAPQEALEMVDVALRRAQLNGDREYSAMLHRVRGYAYAALGSLTDAWADFDESLAVARGRGHAFEVALTLEAISVVAELGGLPLDASADAERAALLEQLGVLATPPPPLALAA
jgi:class 3 adenylate cyclase/tetratricopeptide (TPR) repeat protein